MFLASVLNADARAVRTCSDCASSSFSVCTRTVPLPTRVTSAAPAELTVLTALLARAS